MVVDILCASSVYTYLLYIFLDRCLKNDYEAHWGRTASYPNAFLYVRAFDGQAIIHTEHRPQAMATQYFYNTRSGIN